MATFTVGRHSEIIQRVLKINSSTKSLVERLCDFKIYAVSVLSYSGSISARHEATLKAKAHALSVLPQERTTLFPPGVGSVCCLGLDLVGIHCISLKDRDRTAACSNTPSQGFDKEYDFSHVLFALLQLRKGISCTLGVLQHWGSIRLDRNGKLDDSPQDMKQKAATTLLSDELHRHDYAGPRHSASHETCVACFSSWAYRWFPVLCNGLCTAQRFHAEDYEQMHCVGWRDEPYTLTLSLQ